MASQSLARTVDLQRMITDAAKLELKALHAAVEYLQLWIGQAAKLSNIASSTLQAIEDDKASLSETARRLTEFGKQNAEVFGDLSSRLSRSYYDELGRLTAVFDAGTRRPARGRATKRRPALAKKAAGRKAGPRKHASAGS